MKAWSLLEMRPGLSYFLPLIQSTFSVQGHVLRSLYVLTHVMLRGGYSYYHHHRQSHF